jgi:peroxiredoxin
MSADWLWPAPADDGAARHLVLGTVLPSCPLPAHVGGFIDPGRLPGGAVLFIYPWTGRPGIANPPDWDDIPGAHGSTPELEGIRDRFEDFLAAGVAVYALSGQSCEWHRELAERLAVPFPLLSDDGHRFADAARLPTFNAGADRYLARLTLVLDRSRIVRVFYPVHPPDTHAAEVLAAIGG